MKKLILIFLVNLFALGMMAQDKPETPPKPTAPPIVPVVPAVPDDARKNEDTIKVKVGNYKVIIIDNEKKKGIRDSILNDTLDVENDDDENGHHHKKIYKSWAGFDFGINGYLNPQNSTKMPEGYDFLEVNYRRSFSFGLNIFEKDIPVFSDYVKLATGLGVEWNNYVFNNNTRLVDNPDTIFGYNDSLVKFDKSKLGLIYLNLPILLQFNTNADPKKAFHISAGMIISYNIQAKTTLEYDLNKNSHTDKNYGDFHVNPLRYGLTARVGYGNFKIFADYNLSSLFVKDEGPELYPFTVGICVIPF